MRVVGTAGASAAAKPIVVLRTIRSAAALAPSFGAYAERRLVVHWTINEGPALGGPEAKTSISSNRIGVATHENQNKPNIEPSRARSPENHF